MVIRVSLPLPNPSHSWPSLYTPWSPGLPVWELHWQLRTCGQLLLWPVWPWHDMCTWLNLAANAFATLPCTRLWKRGWVMERIFSNCSFSWKTLCIGVVTSPNYPGNYPNNLDKTETIQVMSGKILRLEFTNFAVWVCGDINTCQCDYVKITDGDGTILMDQSCGFSWNLPLNLTYMPPIITTRSNTVKILFRTDVNSTITGWSLRWTAMTPGLNRQACSSQILYSVFVKLNQNNYTNTETAMMSTLHQFLDST